MKLWDDSEKLHEVDAKLGRKSSKPTIETPYRWLNWAANENFTGYQNVCQGVIDVSSLTHNTEDCTEGRSNSQ
ncbi:hypothetical protein PN465_16010 [Nodularia spumigena CS-584]|uniref:Transposase DDE domain-containing protein n=1 Tax=Nodularia spumigena UHCC 0060 TaxID=3110300 RepID=A0ABU5UXN3_NODSP|nr:hypothetical protein [Nodularia spumigena]MDB9383709.1 hypothetical protein [Nodularia spumigena CS-584]MEA5526364.1 hypothetical protein [Nodularia spumigena UHCC 0143]MEA5611076.1 hypothetical protein [Nodularia spumigena UHCC 0060]